MGCTHSRVAPYPPPSPTIKESRFTRFKKWFLPKRHTIPDKTTIMVAVDHSGKLSQKLEEKKPAYKAYRRSSMKPVMVDRGNLKRTAFGFGRRDVVLPPIELEEQVEITVAYTVRESKIIIDPNYVSRGDGFRVVARKFTVPKSDKSARKIVSGLTLLNRVEKKAKEEAAKAKKAKEEAAKSKGLKPPRSPKALKKM